MSLRKLVAEHEKREKAGVPVKDFLLQLREHGYNVDAAFDLCSEKILCLPVIKVTNLRTCAGKTYTYKIVLSHLLWMEPGKEWEAVFETFMHELAHLITGLGEGHNWKWKWTCRKIGCDDSRCHNLRTMQRKPRKRKLVAACFPCDKKWHAKKKLSEWKIYRCPSCGEIITRIKGG